MNLVRLRRILSEYFSEGELRDLAFDLGIDYDNLPDNGKSDKARELVAYCVRHRMGVELLKTIKRHRPDNEYWSKAVEQVQNEQMGETGEWVVVRKGTGPLSDRIDKLNRRINLMILAFIITVILTLILK